MLDTDDDTLPKRFNPKAEAQKKLFKLLKDKEDHEKMEKHKAKLNQLEKDQIQIFEELGFVLEESQDLAYVVSRSLVQSGITDSYMPDHYLKLLPLTLLNKYVDEYFDDIEHEKYKDMLKE